MNNQRENVSFISLAQEAPVKKGINVNLKINSKHHVCCANNA